VTSDEEIAGAIAYFEQSDDKALLQEVLRSLRPRAAAAVRRFQELRREAPAPQEVAAALEAATKEAALRTVRSDLNFGQLQAISRAVGRRLESLGQGEVQVPKSE
jgi:undecaprenyl pyrophosphate synthase